MIGTRIISLRGDQFALIDEEDYALVSARNNWRVKCVHGVYYALSRNPRGHFPRDLSMHRLIMNAQQNQQIDHINRNGLDNRRSNLRFATHSQNMANRGKQKSTSSRYKGVHLTSYNRWRAQISVNGKKLFLGYFLDEREAAQAYDRAAKEYFREFASPNFKEEDIE